MRQSITIARPAEEVLAYVADISHWQDWLPHLRREETDLQQARLEVDRAAGTIRWSFPPGGEWKVEGEGEVTRLTLTVGAETATPSDPTERETPESALEHGVEAALQSLKSHIERARGGDPDLHTGDMPSRVYGHDPERR